ncbi:TonB-dependent receptor [candidate division KSB1 bacterium]|nr:TonB-dependent receptor [candidate division KSB1 bacterium]
MARKDIRGRYPDGAEYNSTGFYLRDEYPLNPQWAMIAGGRYSLYRTRFGLQIAQL